MPTDISDLCCVNSACPDKGKRAAKNMGFVRWTGKNRNIRFVRGDVRLLARFGGGRSVHVYPTFSTMST
jgi:hypothetical protein